MRRRTWFQIALVMLLPSILLGQWLIRVPGSYLAFLKGSDIAGIGKILDLSGGVLRMEVDHYWLGDQGRITGDQTEEDYFVKKIVVKAGGNRALSPCYGEALLCHRNATVGDPGWCELDMLVSDVRWMYSQYATRLGKEAALQSPPAFIPFSIESLLQPLANICTHEIGHLLGLVSPIYFHSGYDGHNPFKNQRKIMNYTIDVPLIINGNMREWYELNATYLEFILPKPK